MNILCLVILTSLSCQETLPTHQFEQNHIILKRFLGELEPCKESALHYFFSKFFKIFVIKKSNFTHSLTFRRSVCYCKYDFLFNYNLKCVIGKLYFESLFLYLGLFDTSDIKFENLNVFSNINVLLFIIAIDLNLSSIACYKINFPIQK